MLEKQNRDYKIPKTLSKLNVFPSFQLSHKARNTNKLEIIE